ncbi:hypothetical protein HG536_0E00710 [Torulaspora globosa]|uniref:Uncharacterized protein n=1 Tax=Torulaspora globosa TaxID=48254 RepID=A0A7G3ZI25_9SACH|nr:uncharacterized protein HG536_0E00710 [Torulaspora globosa]QLL33161.1 hypothetical protein HG536_0E00710 [Torulaspora globosa]
MSCERSIWPIVSDINGSISFFCSFISLFPQILETFRDKTVEGLSPYFLLAWVAGDITTLSGAILTDQLMFQVAMALYFLLNDLFICGQYYYYGILYRNALATTGHESKPHVALTPSETHTGPTGSGSRKGSAIARALAVASAVGTSEAFPIKAALSSLVHRDLSHDDPPVPVPGNSSTSSLGRALAWTGAVCYVGARIPQLWKNYKRKSTDGISPFLFGTTLLSNVTYNLNVLTSCGFIGSSDRRAFVLNALPFLLGASVTILFDLVYFYQHYVLYAEDMNLRALEREQLRSSAEASPLLHE